MQATKFIFSFFYKYPIRYLKLFNIITMVFFINYLLFYYLYLYTVVPIQEKFYERSLIEADRELVEQGADEILDKSNEVDVVLLVVGDPFGATTHADILLRARDLNIDTKVIHNASIMNAIGCCGLQVTII